MNMNVESRGVGGLRDGFVILVDGDKIVGAEVPEVGVNGVVGSNLVRLWALHCLVPIVKLLEPWFQLRARFSFLGWCLTHHASAYHWGCTRE
jgi:hypothetical protein